MIVGGEFPTVTRRKDVLYLC